MVFFYLGLVAVLGMLFGWWGVAAGIGLIIFVACLEQWRLRVEVQAAQLQMGYASQERLAALIYQLENLIARLPAPDGGTPIGGPVPDTAGTATKAAATRGGALRGIRRYCDECDERLGLFEHKGQMLCGPCWSNENREPPSF